MDSSSNPKMACSTPSTPDILVALKVSFQGSTRRFKLPLRDVGANVLESKIRSTLCISAEANAIFERYSDSASSYVVLDPANLSVWKQLYRAAKAKQKLKLRVTLQDREEEPKGPKPVTVEDEPEQDLQDANESKVEEASLISTAADTADQVVSSLSSLTNHPSQTDVPAYCEEHLATAQAQLPLRPRYSEDKASVFDAKDVSSPEVDSSVCVSPKAANFAVCCNNCDRTIPDSHYHCSTCDDGDFDLCSQCVEQGITCYGANHWLIKRFVRGDHILVSTTERIAPKPKTKEIEPTPTPKPAHVPVPAGLRACPPISPVSAHYAPYRRFSSYPLRTCNSCVQEMPDWEFLHCTTCEDFDLCKTCFGNDQHGHHPKHGFAPAVEGTPMPHEITKRLAPGRAQRHHAICDGCDKFIFGVRHKCLDCPDWDYCPDCVVNAAFVHPHHRFVPIYEQLADARQRAAIHPCHYGICCDGPLCNGIRKSYIVGARYKCTVCRDTDFCANCEASPANTHNRTHPLILFKTPVRRVEITTKGEDNHGQKLPVMGDRPMRKMSPQAIKSSASNSTTTTAQTVVDMKPEPIAEVDKREDKGRELRKVNEDKPLASETGKTLPHRNLHVELRRQISTLEKLARHRQLFEEEARRQRARLAEGPKAEDVVDKLVAIFERDTIPDGTVMPPNQVFEQTWVLRNGGDIPWPAGCSVKYAGGDYMGHFDASQPVGVRDLESAYKSTICQEPLAPGQEYRFTVLLRTPARDGKVISYWRLTTKNGDKFGPRIWCDITVQKPKAVEQPMENPLVTEDNTAPQAEPVPESSQVIFPKLEMEVLETSSHEEVKPQAIEPTEETDEFEDCGEDDAWAEESDDGFLTDEEYDILDASDEEYLVEQKRKTQK